MNNKHAHNFYEYSCKLNGLKRKEKVGISLFADDRTLMTER